MNQAASATRRPPADTTASAGGCCPMLNAPFLGLQMSSAGAQCFLNPQAQQIVHQLARQQQQQSNVVLSPQQQTVSQQSSNLVGQPQQLQSQPQQPTIQRSHNQTSNHYSTSLAAHNFSLQQSIVNRLPSLNCALAAAAFASYLPQFQQPLMTQNHQATPINQPAQTVAPSISVTQSNTSTTFTNQVPPSNFNSYSPAQSFINNTRHTVPQSTPPVAVHHHQQTTNDIPNNILPTNLNTTTQNTQPAIGSENRTHQNVQSPRPLVDNTALNSSTGQMADSIYLSPQHRPTDLGTNIHNHQPSSTPSPSQHLAQLTRNILNDDALNSQILQAVLLQQFLEQQIAPPLPPPPAPQVQSQQMSAPQQLINTTLRTQAALPSTGQLPAVMTPAQQATSMPIAPLQQHRPSEQVSESQQQAFQQPAIQSRISQAPPTQPASLPADSYQTLLGNAASVPYLSQPNNDLHIQRSPSDQVLQAHQGGQTVAQAPQVPMQQPQSPQHTQPQAGLGMSFYPYPQDTRAIESLAAFANNNIIRQLIASLAHGALRIDSHQQFPIHHYHQHLHGTHHHHHGQNGQANGQDASMPLDSLAINESKPRGLSRAEIDSLTPYMHTNEKDNRSCVICLSKFELKSKIRPLPCNHAFHAKCVDKWLRTNRTCPICRRDALKTFNGKIKRI